MQVRHSWMRLSALLLCFGAVPGRGSQDSYPILVYPAARATTPIEIDGHLTESAWASAPLVSGFTFYDHPDLAPVQTSFQVLFDEQRLYFGVICDEPLADRLPPHPVPRDDRTVFGREAVEIFLDPAHDHTHYFQFGLDAAGSLYDSEGQNAVWNSTAEAKVWQEEGRWTLEFGVPWQDLGIAPQRGQILGVNVCRDRYLQGRQWTNWSQTQANFHDPLRFGHLVLDPTPEQWGELGAQLHKPDRRGPLRLFNAQGVSGQTYRALLTETFDGVDRLLAELKVLQGQEGPDPAEELGRRIAALEQDLLPLVRVRVSSQDLDAHTYVQTDLALHQLLERMKQVVWEARLTALLRRI